MYYCTYMLISNLNCFQIFVVCYSLNLHLFFTCHNNKWEKITTEYLNIIILKKSNVKICDNAKIKNYEWWIKWIDYFTFCKYLSLEFFQLMHFDHIENIYIFIGYQYWYPVFNIVECPLIFIHLLCKCIY